MHTQFWPETVTKSSDRSDAMFCIPICKVSFRLTHFLRAQSNASAASRQMLLDAAPQFACRDLLALRRRPRKTLSEFRLLCCMYGFTGTLRTVRAKCPTVRYVDWDCRVGGGARWFLVVVPAGRACAALHPCVPRDIAAGPAISRGAAKSKPPPRGSVGSV